MKSDLSLLFVSVAAILIFLIFTAFAQAAPVNDDCLDATTVIVGSGQVQVYEGSTLDAVESSGVYDVWYAYDPNTNVLADISLCGSDFDTTLAVYDLCNGSVIASNDDDFACGGLQSGLVVNLTANNEYLIQIAGYNGARGDYTLTVAPSSDDWTPDFDKNGDIGVGDLNMLLIYWLQDQPLVDIAPEGGDGIIDLLDMAEISRYWTGLPVIPM